MHLYQFKLVYVGPKETTKYSTTNNVLLPGLHRDNLLSSLKV